MSSEEEDNSNIVDNDDIISGLVDIEAKKDAIEEEKEIVERIIIDVDDELSYCKQQLRYRETTYAMLDALEVDYSNSSAIRREGNRITHLKAENKWETCVIKKKFSKGIHSIVFKRIGKNPVVFGIVNAMYACPSSGLNITDNNCGTGIAVGDTFVSTALNKVKNSTVGMLVGAAATGALVASSVAGPIIGAVFGIGYLFKRVVLGKVDNNNTIKNGEGEEMQGFTRIENNDIITLEVNLENEDPSKRTMYYYVNGMQSPTVFTGLPNEIQFAVSLKDDNSYTEFICLQESEEQTATKIENMKNVEWMKSKEN